ncbi:MBL fold metallo-hydrolase [Mycobacterium sp.]|uniref:MBL fold metallo-hydrolase n=1 Tax=Mycobacterium sp. TaxID=1785 RepID=UPI002BECA117|nr:MBL fold metallo-hydrolase [Mycobacterium sp.]HTH84760.1 MBL fold metallo-hydrolase [Mycobacterium sp.]
MKVHHLNCGTLYPYGCGRMVCHVLLVETDNGLVLIDTGFGPKDCGDPAQRVGPSRYLIRPVLQREQSAVAQVEQLGFRGDDVRHIVITHFDCDHVGGISEFPEAQIHVTAAEALGALRTPTRGERFRFRPVQWAHGPKIVEHTPQGEKWRGFAAAKQLDEVSPGIVLISLPGHTRGHACVAVDAGHRWVLHCGDAFFHHGTVDGTARMPRALAAFEFATAFDRKMMRQNHTRLAELNRRREPDMFMICSHDRRLYEQAKATG